MKKTVLIVLLVIAGMALLSILWFVGKYNSMITAEQDVAQQQAQVEVVLQRRFDLIPNFVAATKGIMTQEQTIFGQLAEARTKYGSAASGSTEKVDAANQVESALGRLLVVVENYPDLKSNQAVKDLMTELAGSENRIAVERKRYNESVTEFNKMIKTFPNNMLAGLFGFDEKPLFQAAAGAETVPVVDLQ